MRVLLCGAAAIALSGCSWLGYQPTTHNSGHSTHNNHGSYNSGHYNTGRVNTNPWTYSGAIGTEFNVGSDVFTGERSGASNYVNVAADDAFETGIRAELGAEKKLASGRVFSGNVFYSQADGKTFTARRAPSTRLVGTMGDYESYGLEAGLRQYVQFTPNGLNTYKPYVEGRLGAAYIDDIALNDFRSAAAAVGTGSNRVIYDGGWVPTAAGLVGIEKPISNKASIGIETGLRYTGALDGPTLGGALAGTNDADDQWSVPLNIRGRYTF